MRRVGRGTAARALVAVAGAASLTALGVSPVGAVTVVPAPAGKPITVNNGPGDQTDPHVSGNLVAYTDTFTVPGTTVIRYENLAAGTDNMVPNNVPGSSDYLADVDGTRIVFTKQSPGTEGAIELFDTASPSAGVTTLAPLTGSARNEASIGGNTVAWQDFTNSPTGLDSALIAYDLSAGTRTVLGPYGSVNQYPTVSPDGSVIAWLSCDPQNIIHCNVRDAIKSSTGWTVNDLTADDQATQADTNGNVVVYSKGLSYSSSLYEQPVGGGTEVNLMSGLSGSSAYPSVSGSIVSFEFSPSGQSQTDIWNLNLDTGAAYPLTNTPNISEHLTVVSVGSDGTVNVAWVQRGNTLDIYGYQYSLDAPLTITHSAIGAYNRDAAAGVTFKDADPAGTLTQYSATVAWGDGTTSPAPVVVNPFGGFAAGSAHRYANPGTYTVTVTINDVGGASASVSGTLTAT